MIATPSNSILLRQFREFYAEVVRRQAAVERTSPPPALGSELAAPATEAVDATCHVLHALLEAQGHEAAGLGGLWGARVYQEVQYVFAALADEIFLHTDWAGRTQWPLLESSLFHTHSAGETIFDRIDRLLERPEHVFTDLAAVYFWALALGFEGKYRNSPDRASLQTYRTRLFQILYRDRPRLLELHRPLFPDSYQHTLEEGAGRKLPNPRLWMTVLTGVLALWIVVAYVAWRHVGSGLNQVVCQIDGVGDCGPPPAAKLGTR